MKVESNEEKIKMLCDGNKRLIVAMQAAYIEWKHGGGAGVAMTWITNTLSIPDPDLIPDKDVPYGTDAQAYFDANRPNPMPMCKCGRPSNIEWMGQGFCSRAHYAEAKAKSLQ